MFAHTVNEWTFYRHKRVKDRVILNGVSAFPKLCKDQVVSLTTGVVNPPSGLGTPHKITRMNQTATAVPGTHQRSSVLRTVYIFLIKINIYTSK